MTEESTLAGVFAAPRVVAASPITILKETSLLFHVSVAARDYSDRNHHYKHEENRLVHLSMEIQNHHSFKAQFGVLTSLLNYPAGNGAVSSSPVVCCRGLDWPSFSLLCSVNADAMQAPAQHNATAGAVALVVSWGVKICAVPYIENNA
ncbi:hypothetical protein EVAR_25210_1 [Eumeta japonica]|uniref:Uncharacterized protein n=1 Tax=Eumeta variegata TaxID=151549 RepID=A0A4C1WHG8_EUMVA|nr:hypothetical protein EVAR_25210_1 [Eumeta japonica]